MDNAGSADVDKEKDLMKRETYLYFISGLGEVIRESGMTQEEFAGVADTSQTNLSRVLNDKTGCSARWRKRICAALGKTEAEVIERGERDSLPQVTPVAPIAPASPAPSEGIPSDAVAAVMDLFNRARACEEKLRFWKDLISWIPCGVLLLKEGVVLYQNVASSRMCPSAIVGENLCATCRDKGEDKQNCLGCMVERTQRTGDKTSFGRDIHGRHYTITTSFITINATEYQVIISIQTQQVQEKKEGE